jgi:hypothetical protein
MQEQLPRVAMIALKNTAFDSIMLALNSPELKFYATLGLRMHILNYWRCQIKQPTVHRLRYRLCIQ